MAKYNVDFSGDTELKQYKGKYTKYAIYIDRHIPDIAEPYKNPEVEKNIFEYTYAICYVLACKKGFFQNIDDYKDFAIYAATEFFFMFRDRYVNQGKVRMGKVIKPIKSSLNIIKRVLYAFSVEYAKKYFYQTYKDDWGGKEEDHQARKKLEDRKKTAIANYIKSDVENSYNYRIIDAVTETCTYIPLIIKDIIKDTPYKNDNLVQSRLYKTCLLSFINSITFPNEILDKIENNMNFEQINKKYKKERENCIILWHLDIGMTPYVDILLTRIREKFVKEIEGDIQEYSLDESTLNDIMATAYATYDTDQSNEDF